ncbi:hypothetical protein [Desulfosarcina cetonica]|uniref:hypothetical protein n=1 Tax=Desulfosarcina cetonica TaxID=90730 RepID=UPI0006CF5891|nr:hypothetical protein [Desulfosarcina cetonica]
MKQTILFPFVTLGSLINFCDCLMAGGTSRDNHSEVGSSYIHFNYTPNQDKATASLIGDVPNGVMLNQAPIFLGGQGGLVGPCRVAFGTVIAAGSIYRKDQLKPDRLVFEGGGRGGSVPYTTGIYRSVKRQVMNNFVYLGNLVALMAWYTHVRSRFVGDFYPLELHKGLVDTLNSAIAERVKRFGSFCEKLDLSKQRYLEQMGEGASATLLRQKEALYTHRIRVDETIAAFLDQIARHGNPNFESTIQNQIDSVGDACYLDVIKSLDPRKSADGTQWLQEITDQVTKRLLGLFPALG